MNKHHVKVIIRSATYMYVTRCIDANH